MLLTDVMPGRRPRAIDFVDESSLRRLARRESPSSETPSCLTLMMPTHRTGRERLQDPIRFRNLLGEAEAKWGACGVRAVEVRRRLEPLASLAEDAVFWSFQAEGLAAFLHGGEVEVVSTPTPLDERVEVDRRFHLLPLLPIVQEDARFFVLALSPKSIRLCEGTRHTSRLVDLPEGIQDLADYERFIDEEKQLQFHTRAQPYAPTRSVARGRAGVFHGHGAGSESEQKTRLGEYCHMVDERVYEALRGEKTPLVLACDKRLAVIYRDVTRYSHVMENATIEGNPELFSPSELCAKAWPHVRRTLSTNHVVALRRYAEAAATGKAVNAFADVLSAAEGGRIDTLLVAAAARRWGTFDAATRTAGIHEMPGPGDEELVNRAALYAYRQGATVHVAPAEEMPTDSPVAAVLRY